MPDKGPNRTRRRGTRLFWLLGVLGTLGTLVSLIWNLELVEEGVLDQTHRQADAALRKDLAYRKLVSSISDTPCRPGRWSFSL